MASASANVPQQASNFSSLDDALESFQERGFLYQTDPDVAKLLDSLGSEANAREAFEKYFKEFVFRHEVLRKPI